MDEEMQSIVDNLIKHLAEIQATRLRWEPEFDVHSYDLAGKVGQVINTKASDSAAIGAFIEKPGDSFRAIADTLVACACWLCINGSAETRRLLYETFAPWGGIVTLLTNISGRLFSHFKNSGDIRYVRLALSAIALLGDNADPRDDSMFIDRVCKALVERGHDAPLIFQEFTDISTGQARALFERHTKMKAND